MNDQPFASTPPALTDVVAGYRFVLRAYPRLVTGAIWRQAGA